MNNSTICDLEERKKKCEQSIKTIQLIQSLPDDVSKHIYEEYILVKSDCIEFLNNLYENKKSQQLEYKHLIKITERVLNNQHAVEYLRKRCLVFDMMYEKHYIKKEKCFICMETLDGFILSMLMYLYH